MSKIIDRIALIIENKGISTRAFEMSIGASNGMIGRAVSKNTDISAEWLSKIINTYPDVNTEWLLTGNGNIFITKTPKKGDSPIVTENVTSIAPLPKLQKKGTNKQDYSISSRPDKVADSNLDYSTENDKAIPDIVAVVGADNNEGENVTENVFTGWTDAEVSNFIEQKFTEHLMEMFETGRAYPSAIVNKLLEEKDARMRELEKQNWVLQQEVVDQQKKTPAK